MATDPKLAAGVGIFAAVVDAGSFVGAARALGMTQSGVSRAIARLEARLGVRLVERSPRAVTLTEEGRSLHEVGAPLLEKLDDAARTAAGARLAVRGKLRVTVNTAFGQHHLVPRLGEFLARHPELEVELSVRDRVSDLVAEGIDVAVLAGEPQSAPLVRQEIGRFRVLTCASPAYLARRGTPRHPRDLAAHECILVRDPFTGRPFAWEFQRGPSTVAVQVRGRLLVTDGISVLGAMGSGHDIGQLFEISARAALASGQIVQVLPRWADERYPIHVYHRSREHAPAKVRAFVDFVREVSGRGDRLARDGGTG